MKHEFDDLGSSLLPYELNQIEEQLLAITTPKRVQSRHQKLEVMYWCGWSAALSSLHQKPPRDSTASCRAFQTNGHESDDLR